MRKTVTLKLARAGVIAGLYVALSLITLPVASGAIQFRVAEALCLLPLLFREAIPALAVGCLLSNVLSACNPLDVALGSVITLVAALLTYLIGRVLKKESIKIITGGLFPVAINAFLLPVIWYFCYGQLEYLYILQVVFLLISQGVAVYVVGVAVYLPLLKAKNKGLAFLN